MTNGVIRTGGFVAWLFALIYNRIRKVCKNIFVKITVHSLGLSIMIIGFYFLIAKIPSFMSIAGMYLSFIGLVVFVIPFGIEK
jgi:hypothetical protein